jgi:phage terminase small subunit
MAKRRKQQSRQKDDRRERFAQEYIKDLNGTQAAIRAGYAAKSAHVTGSRLLSDAKVQRMIEGLKVEVRQADVISVQRTLQEIARIAYGDHRKLYDDRGNLRLIHELDDDAAALLAGVESFEEYEMQADATGKLARVATGMTRKVKTWSKVKALDQCMAYLGMHKTTNPSEGGGLALTINLSNGKKVSR